MPSLIAEPCSSLQGRWSPPGNDFGMWSGARDMDLGTLSGIYFKFLFPGPNVLLLLLREGHGHRPSDPVATGHRSL
jgi:hypothetical protein